MAAQIVRSYDHVDVLFKVLLVGDAGGGKTCFYARYATEVFPERTAYYTFGNSFVSSIKGIYNLC